MQGLAAKPFCPLLLCPQHPEPPRCFQTLARPPPLAREWRTTSATSSAGEGRGAAAAAAVAVTAWAAPAKLVTSATRFWGVHRCNPQVGCTAGLLLRLHLLMSGQPTAAHDACSTLHILLRGMPTAHASTCANLRQPHAFTAPLAARRTSR